MLDLTSSDALTADYESGTASAIGAKATESGPFATVLPATVGLTAGWVGVAAVAASDDQLGYYELGEEGDVIVDALVVVGSSATKGARLKVSTYTLSDALGGVTAVFEAGIDGTTYATLLEDATVDSKKGPASAVNYRRVILHPRGLAVAGDGANQALTPDDVADPDIFFARKTRYAAFSGKGPKGKGHWASIAWGASAAADFTLSATVSSRETLVNNTNVVGTEAAGRASFFVRANGRVVAYFAGSTILVDTADAAITFDGSVYVIAVRFYQSGANVVAEVRINGELKATGSAAGTLTTTGTGSVVIGGTSANSVRWPGAIWNVSFTDNTTPANSVVLRMDERVGNYRNSYSGTTAAAYATRNGIVESIVIHDTDGSALPVPAVPPARMRYAACSGLGASGVNEMASVTWAPTGVASASFRLGATVASSVTPAGSVYIMGRAAANSPSLHVSTSGVISVVGNTTLLLSTDAGALVFNGTQHDIRCDITDTAATIYVNGAAVKTGTFTAQSWTAGGATHRIGASSAGQRWPGSIHNVEFTDYVTAANSLFFLMDEPSGNYADSAQSPSVTNATRNGYVPTCAVVSTDGRGMVYQGQQPLVYAAKRGGSAQALDGSVSTEHILTFDTESNDPTASLVHTTGIWTAPCAGRVMARAAFNLSGSIAESLAASFYKGGTAVGGIAWSQPATVGLRTAVDLEINVSAGDAIDARVYAIDVGNTGLVQNYASIVILFYPTPVAN